MVANIYDRPMFRQDKPLQAEDDGRRLKQNVETKPQNQLGLVYPAPSYQVPLGGGLENALAMTASQVDPGAFADAARLLQPPRTTQEIAAEYDALYAPEAQEASNFKSDKFLALARFGLGLMQPTPGGAIAPALAKAGDTFVQDLAAISQAQRKEKARLGQIESEEERARRNYILQTATASENATRALESQLIMKAFEFNLNEDQRTTDYMRELQKMFYNYQYSTDETAMKKHFELLKDRYKKTPEVLFDQETGNFAMGYIQESADGTPIPYFPVNEGGVFKYVARPEAIITNFQLNNKGDFDPSAKNIMDVASRINNAKQALKFIRETQQTIIDNPGIIGLPGRIQDIIQSVGSTAFDIMDSLRDEGKISAESYDKQVKRLENNVINHLKSEYSKYSDDPNAMNFSTEAGMGSNEYEIYRKFFNPDIPQNKIRMNSIYYTLARARKDTGRLNVNDIDNAKESINIFGLEGSDAIKASLNIIYEEIEQKLKSDLLQLPPGYENLIQDIPYSSFAGQTAGQDIVISSTQVQNEFVPTDSAAGLDKETNQTTDGAPMFDENLGG